MQLLLVVIVKLISSLHVISCIINVPVIGNKFNQMVKVSHTC